MTNVRGVFLWRSAGEAAFVIHGAGPSSITDCIAQSERPRWWQFRKRWRLLRMIETMPDGIIEVGGPAPDQIAQPPRGQKWGPHD